MQKTFNTLYSKKSTNKVLQWDIKVNSNKKTAIITTIYGDIGGKMITNNRTVTHGKNIGKKNETTPFEQAVAEATSKWTDKLKKNGYVEFLKVEQDNESTSKSDLSQVRPMLAQRYEDRKKYIKYPCFVQPKLDGIRCIAYMDNNEIKLMSRQGKHFPHLNHIKKELDKFEFTGFLDGELFTTNLEFKEISGIVRKEKLKSDDVEKSKLIEYHIYDTFNLDSIDTPFKDRTIIINNLFKKNKFLIKVPTYICKNENKMLEKYDNFINKDYEGIMIRNSDGKYKLKYRSNDLMKLKPFQDNEYKIVDFKEGAGRDKGCVIWICDNGHGETFSVRPKGSLDDRKQLFINGKEYIGQMLTVRFQELLDNSPRFGVGIDIRNYE